MFPIFPHINSTTLDDVKLSTYILNAIQPAAKCINNCVCFCES